MREYHVYILANKPRGTLYVGVTRDVERRLAQHRAATVHSFTREYAVHLLVHLETFADVREAITREKRLKKWPRTWKVVLIEAANPEWRDHAGRGGLARAARSGAHPGRLGPPVKPGGDIGEGPADVRCG